MKLLIVLSALVAIASAGFPAASYYGYAHAPAIYAAAPAVAVYAKPHIGSSQHRAQDTLGQYTYGLTTGDGTHKSESRAIDGSVAGSFGYTSPEGARIETSYTAGPGGFRAVGNAIPQQVAPTPEVVAATNAHLAAKANAYAATGYIAPAVTAYAHPVAYAHAPVAYAHAPLAYAHHVNYALPSSFGYKFHA